MILLNYYNEDGYITQIVNYIVNAMDDMGLNYRIAFREQVYELAEKYKPEVLLAYHPPYDFERYLKDINKISCHKLLWESESPFELDITRKALEVFHYAFVMDKNSADALQKEHPGNKVMHVPCAFFPKVHRPYHVGWEYKSDLVFVGAPFPSRIKFFEENKKYLNNFNVTIIGFGWKGSMVFPGNFRVINDIISDVECMKHYSGSKVALNLHRQNSDSWGHNELNIEPSSPANRLFEIAGTKTAQMVDDTRNPEIFDYFKNGLTVFKNNDEFKKGFEQLLGDYKLRKERALTTYKTALSDHTYKNRIKDFLINLLK